MGEEVKGRILPARRYRQDSLTHRTPLFRSWLLNPYRLPFQHRAQIPHSQGIRFNWDDELTYSSPFSLAPLGKISAIFLVAPLVLNCHFQPSSISPSPITSHFSEGRIRDSKTDMVHGEISKVQHLSIIRDGNRIVTATGERKVPFTSAEDIAGFAFRALLDEGRRSGGLFDFGREVVVFDQVCLINFHVGFLAKGKRLRSS